MIEMAYAGRYTILLMSVWSIYIGSLYNECFALPMNFGSNYRLDFRTNSTFWWKDVNWTYIWGVDPIWKGATNELLYYNSLKMKTSVIVGIFQVYLSDMSHFHVTSIYLPLLTSQMTLGLVLHLLNSIHFGNWLDVLWEFIPRVLFLWSTFGYLVFIIFVKWNTNYFAQPGGIGDTTNGAPGLLNVMIAMFLGGRAEGTPEMYPGQFSFEGYTSILFLFA
jgi:V-type H+-transporting ATPase subunit a